MTDDNDRDAIIERWFAEGARQLDEGPVDIERLTSEFEEAFPIIAERIKQAELEDRLAESSEPRIETVKIVLAGGFELEDVKAARRYWSDGLVEESRGGTWVPV